MTALQEAGEMTRHVADAGSYAPASEVAARLDAEVLGLLRETTGAQDPAAP